MVQPLPLDMLMITPTDYDLMWNNVEHGRVRQYPKLGCRMTVLDNKVNRSTRLWHMIRDCCLLKTRARQLDSVHFLQVDPLFNCCGGIRMQSDAQMDHAGKKFSLRHVLIRILSPASVLRDIFFVPCFVVVAMTRLKGTFDVCLGIGPWGVLVGWILQKLGKVGLLVYIDRDYEPGMRPDRLRQSYTAWLERFLLRRADSIVTVGHRLKKLRQTQTTKPITLIPNGVDWERFARTRRAPRTHKRLFYVGNLVPWDGLDIVIQAMPAILKQHPSARLTIVGDGVPSYVHHLHHLVRELGLDEAVSFLGSQPNESLPVLMEEAEIGLANSRPVDYRKYACPLKVFEYMAAGLPVIATARTEAADIVRDADAGVAVEFDAAAVARGVVALLDDRARYERLRANAIRYSAQYTWENLVKKEGQLITAQFLAKKRVPVRRLS